ncbi:hypothetical protein K2X89_17140 [Myxococcota bacterium]|nr:hypothetical protein [Myxococcota bacterium]
MAGSRERKVIGGWLRPIVAAVVVLGIGLYLGFGAMIFARLPRPAVEPAAAFAVVFTTTFSAGRLAPRARFYAAVAAAAIACAIGQGVSLSLVGSLAGALVAIGMAAGWSVEGEVAAPLRRGVRIVALVALIGFVAFVYGRYVDWPARPDPLPPTLKDALGPDAERIDAFYETELGGFLDRESLWRIAAEEAVLDVLVERLALEPVSEAPAAFFAMPPRAWPRALPSAGQAYASPGFRSGSRGPDGEHFFLVRDRNGHAFVWVKSNF